MSGATLNFAGNPCNCKEDQPAEFLETIFFVSYFGAVYRRFIHKLCTFVDRFEKLEEKVRPFAGSCTKPLFYVFIYLAYTRAHTNILINFFVLYF
jgi:hypothetical protein